MAEITQITKYSEVPKYQGVCLIMHARSAPNLNQRMMAKQSGFQNLSYLLLEASAALVDDFDNKNV